jgi:sugar phosphate isomerase/epimerase
MVQQRIFPHRCSPLSGAPRMQMSRRELLQAAMALAATAGAPAALRALARAERDGVLLDHAPIGIQLYTVREVLKTNVDRTIAQLARMGYKELEFAGYYDRTPAQIKSLLSANGLSSPSTHIPIEMLSGDQRNATLDKCAEIGHKWVVVPWLDPKSRPNTTDGWKQLSDTLNAVADACVQRGMRGAYHNHEFEFTPLTDAPAKTGHDILIENRSQNLDFELDLYWVTFASRDPLAIVRAHPNLFPLVHVKDSAGAGAQHRQTDVGGGTINWRNLLTPVGAFGIQHRYVENDQPANPMRMARNSVRYLRRLLG